MSNFDPQDRAPQDTAPQDPVRRKNREVVDETWIRAFLHRAPLCALGTVHDGWPFINANLFFYDEEAHVIYLHTAGSGRTRSNIEADGKVCVSISEMGRLLPGPRATDFSTEYASVIIFGRAKVVTDLAEARSAFERQMAKYAKHLRIGRDYEPFTDQEMMRAAMYRIDIERWIAKQNRQPDDFPGAFHYVPEP